MLAVYYGNYFLKAFIHGVSCITPYHVPVRTGGSELQFSTLSDIYARRYGTALSHFRRLTERVPGVTTVCRRKDLHPFGEIVDEHKLSKKNKD